MEKVFIVSGHNYRNSKDVVIAAFKSELSAIDFCQKYNKHIELDPGKHFQYEIDNKLVEFECFNFFDFVEYNVSLYIG